LKTVNISEDSHELLKTIWHFRHYLMADINALEEISKNDLKKEYDEYMTTSTMTIETTSRDGNPAKLPNQFYSSRCAIPICMLIFSAIDLIGRLAEPMYLKQQGKKIIFNSAEFTRHAQVFWHFLAQRDDLDSLKKAEKFQDKYRNSIMHSFFPGQQTLNVGYAIAYRQTGIMSESLFESCLNQQNKMQEILNVEYLLRHFITGLDAFIVVVESGIYNIEINAIYKRYISKY